MDHTVHGILQARILKWAAVPFSRGSSQPRDQTQVSCIEGGFFTSWAAREELTHKIEIDNTRIYQLIIEKKKKKTLIFQVINTMLHFIPWRCKNLFGTHWGEFRTQYSHKLSPDQPDDTVY